MKIQIKASDFLEVFQQYKQILEPLVNLYSMLLENSNYEIDKIKDKKAKEVIAMQLGTKEDFNIEVIEQEGIWQIKNLNKDILVGLLLRNEKIILNYDTKSLNNIDVIEHLNNKYGIEFRQYEEINNIGEGKINWTEINNEVKNNWDKSFFFLDNMHNEQFVQNNKEMILEKVKEDKNLLKETLMKSSHFFYFVVEKLSIPTLLELLNDKPGYLGYIWNNKIKDIQKNTDYSAIIEKEKNDIHEQLNDCWKYLIQNSYNSYGDIEDGGQYDRLKNRLNKQLKEREKQIKIEAQQNQIIIEQVEQLLKNPEIKHNIIKGLLQGDIYKDDFVTFESDIINNPELQAMVINKGLYKTLATSKNFVEKLNEEQLEEFIINCSKRIESSVFSRDDKKHFEKIVNENQLLTVLKNVIKEKKVSIEKFKLNNHQDWKILGEYNTKNKDLKQCLFFIFPKERFVELTKSEITEDNVKHYVQAGGAVHNIKEKINIYKLTDIETIKIICSRDTDILNSKKAPEEWKSNIEIIKEMVKEKIDLRYAGIKEKHIEQASQDINKTIEVVKEDKYHYFYEHLSPKLKNDKRIALALLESTKEVGEVISLLPEFILKDKRFNIEVIKQSPTAIKHLKEDIWNDKEFVLMLLYEVENTNKEKELAKNLPSKIKLFFETFNIQENLYTFFNNYQLQKKLEQKLVNDESKTKEKRMKI